MRGIVALIVLIAAYVFLQAPASAETPTPTQGPTADERSTTITVRNVWKGVPLVGTYLSSGGIGEAYVAGHLCGDVVTAAVTPVGIAFGVSWPFPTAWNEYPCNAIGLPVRLCNANLCTEEFIYQGEDATVDFEWSGQLPSTPTIPTVTGHFLRNGETTAVTVTAARVIGENGACRGSDNPPIIISEIRWLNSNEPGGPCRSVTATFTTVEYGVLEASIDIPAGVDFDYYIEVPAVPSAATPTAATTPTAAATPTATPASLPVAGGSPSSGGATAIALGALGLVLMGSGAFLLKRRP